MMIRAYCVKCRRMEAARYGTEEVTAEQHEEVCQRASCNHPAFHVLAVGERPVEGNSHMTAVTRPTDGKVFLRPADEGKVDVLPPRTAAEVAEMLERGR